MSEITYKPEGDYLIPDLTLPPQPEGRIGKYGRLREQYLKNHRRAAYSLYQIECSLHSHLLEIDQQANEMKDTLMAQLLEKNPLPRTENTLELARHRNQLEAQAEEIVLSELVNS